LKAARRKARDYWLAFHFDLLLFAGLHFHAFVVYCCDIVRQMRMKIYKFLLVE
jgi:hypothetical protein